MKTNNILYFIAIILSEEIKLASSYSLELANITIDYFQIKSVNHGLVLACGNQQEMFHLSKKISEATISLVNNIDSDAFQNDNFLRNFLETHYNRTSTYNSAIVIELNCKNTQRVLELASQLEMFDVIHKWLLVGTYFEEKISILESIAFRLDNDVWFAVKTRSSKYLWKIYDIYNPGWKYAGVLNATFNGFWFSNEIKIIPYNLTNLIEDRDYNIITIKKVFIKEGNWMLYFKKLELRDRRNLFGLKINTVAAITNKPSKGGFLKYLSTPKNVHIDTMHRYGYAIIAILKDVFNFRINVIRTDNWGIVQNGNWTGVIGALVSGQAEISITPTQFKVERIDVIDPTNIIWVARPCIIFKHPRDAGVRNNFLRPLALNVWWATIILLGIVALLFKIASAQSVRISSILKKRQQALEEKHDSAWSFILMITIIGGICQQGFSSVPNMYSGRTMALLILLFSFMMYQFYSASIVSSLLMEPPHTINNIDDLTNSNLEILVEDIPYNYDFFDSTNDPSAIRLKNKKIMHKGIKNTYVSPINGLDLVKKGGYAFQVDVATAYKIIPETFDDRSICDLVEIQLFPPKPTTTIVRKRSSYYKMVTYGLSRIQEHGLMQYHKSHWHYPKPKCTLSGTSNTESVTINEMASAFMLLLISYIIALIILFIELCLQKIKLKNSI